MNFISSGPSSLATNIILVLRAGSNKSASRGKRWSSHPLCLEPTLKQSPEIRVFIAAVILALEPPPQYNSEQRVPILRAHYTDYQNVQIQIEALDASDKQEEDREDFENRYFNVEAAILELIDKHENTATSEVIAHTTLDSHSRSNVRLPILDLPTFSGNYLDWISFKDTFTALIHNSNLYSNIEKFHYLKSCLKNDAQKTIDSFIISGDNYHNAWDALQKRFQNLRIIVQEHVLAILNTPNVNKNSHVSLRKLFDDLTINLAGLKSLNQPTEHWDTLLIPIIVSKFDFLTNRDWESSLNCEIPKLDQLKDFIEKRCFVLESIKSSEQGSSKFTNPNHGIKDNKNSFQNKSQNFNYNNFKMHKNQHQNNSNVQSHIAVKAYQCYLCKKAHFLYHCPDILKLDIPDRRNTVEKLKLCTNCLKNNHVAADCKSSSACRYCKSKHNSLLHETSANSTPGAVFTCANNSNNYTLLSTAEILIKRPLSNEWVKCRALLDQGSQLNFITKSFQEKLELATQTTNLNITGINNINSTANKTVKINFKSRFGSYEDIINCIILEQITENLPSISVNINRFNIPKHLNLADPNYNISDKIDILLGANVFWNIIQTGQVKATHCHPHMQETCLGWILGGNKISVGKNTGSVCNLSLHKLDKQIVKFWELEEYPNKEPSEKSQSIEELACEKHFINTVSRDPSGRFIVKLPFKTSKLNIGDTANIAIKRFNALENKFKRDPALKLKYSEFIQEYIQLNHMSLITEKLHETNSRVFLPHHGVFKQSSKTTKLRVVFDGSAKSSTNISLNDTLAVGPKLQNDIIPILLRFRLYNYVFTADISKMYRQILLAEEDRIYQNIIWRDNLSEQYKVFQLNTVTYGLACAPYLAVRCLHKLASDSEHVYPETSKILLNDFYVDDVLTGSNTLAGATRIRDELIEILSSGCFQLLKFASNTPRLLSNLDHAQSESHLYNFDKNGDSKTLGLIWNCNDDNLRYEINIDQYNVNNVTKRNILSLIAKIYDPLHLIGPVVVKAKLVMQALWRIKLGWDELVPHEILKPWNDLVTQLNILNNIRIPRKVIQSFPYSSIQLHGFCDSSQSAYGACVYLRTINKKETVVNLLCAKSRVAPLKTISIPRLELCAATLLSRLMSTVANQLKTHIDTVYYWTDSTIVLAWLQSSPSNLKIFVANRVSEIQTNSELTQWNHVRSSENPADIISRGILPKDLIHNTLWFNGPKWLSKTEENWPKITQIEQLFDIPDIRPVSLLSVSIAENEIYTQLFSKFSKYQKLINVMAWCLRFIYNSAHSENHTGFLKVDELRASEIKIIKIIQIHSFQEEIIDLEKRGQVNNKSKLKMLNPFTDSSGIIRVGGRLGNSKLQFDKKYPIVLPKHHVTKLIIEAEHKTHLHAGPTSTLAAVRQKYWPLDGRNQVRNITRKCITCFRAKPREGEFKMGNLPETRVTASRPFLNCGVDYGGPIFIKEGTRRSKRTIKAYICLFICFTSKAIHLELVGDLSTESFISALKRFISRRGIVENIYSDNATNFQGARRELRDLFKSAYFENNFKNFLNSKRIKWHFIPARSPHFGGIWEAGIKSVKHHIKRVLGNANLTYEEMLTLLATVEACLNSRPLCPLTEDPGDISALTPGHFLIGCPMTALPEPSLQHLPINRLSRWQHVENIRQHFWNRWSKEYLGHLQHRTKWHRNKESIINVGSVVLLKEPTPPLTWRLGRVLQLHKGNDGVVRVVTIKTNTGETKRSLNNVCVLPMDGDN